MRLFIACTPGSALRTELQSLQSRLRASARTGRFVAPELLHLTVAFLGEQPDTSAAVAALEGVAGSPFTLALDRLGHFPREGGDIWWLGAAPSPPLTALHRRLSVQLERQGFALERRPFRPHLTLGYRVVLPAGFDPRPLLEFPLSLAVDHLSLMESRREAGRLRYPELYRRTLTE